MRTKQTYSYAITKEAADFIKSASLTQKGSASESLQAMIDFLMKNPGIMEMLKGGAKWQS